MKTQFTLKELLWIVALIIFISFLLYGSMQMLINFSDSGKDWISAFIGFLGNVLGGIIGGIVAFVVAAYQINRTLDNEREKQKQLTQTMLRLIREELSDNISVIESAIPYEQECFHLIKTQLSDDTWKSTMTNLNIEDSLIIKLNICYRKVSLTKSLEPDDIDDNYLTDLKAQFNDTISSIKDELRPEINQA